MCLHVPVCMCIVDVHVPVRTGSVPRLEAANVALNVVDVALLVLSMQIPDGHVKW